MIIYHAAARPPLAIMISWGLFWPPLPRRACCATAGQDWPRSPRPAFTFWPIVLRVMAWKTLRFVPFSAGRGGHCDTDAFFLPLGQSSARQGRANVALRDLRPCSRAAGHGNDRATRRFSHLPRVAAATAGQGGPVLLSYMDLFGELFCALWRGKRGASSHFPPVSAYHGYYGAYHSLHCWSLIPSISSRCSWSFARMRAHYKQKQHAPCPSRTAAWCPSARGSTCAYHRNLCRRPRRPRIENAQLRPAFRRQCQSRPALTFWSIIRPSRRKRAAPSRLPVL